MPHVGPSVTKHASISSAFFFLFVRKNGCGSFMPPRTRACDRRNRNRDKRSSLDSVRFLFASMIASDSLSKSKSARFPRADLLSPRCTDVEFLQTGTSTFRIASARTLETRARASIHVISASQHRRRTPLLLSQARCAISTPRFNEVHQSFDLPLLRRSLNISRGGGGGQSERVRASLSVRVARSLYILSRGCVSHVKTDIMTPSFTAIFHAGE